MDVVKERLQIEGQISTTQHYGSSFSAVRNIVATEGVRGLYRAYWMHQFTWAPYNGIYFSIYEHLKDAFAKNSEGKESRGKSLICSFIAGTAASVATSPIDLVKTRLQVQKSNVDLFDYKGPFDAFGKIVQREGIRALFDGVGARVFWLTPRLTMAVTMYEVITQHLSSKMK